MLTLVFDTETTGLPPKGNPKLEACPWVIQLAAILYNGERPVGHFSTFVQPACNDQIGTIPNDKFWVENGLTYPEIMPTALELKMAMSMFNKFLAAADRVVAHNTQFDDKLIRYSYRRLVQADYPVWEHSKKLCTMLTAMPELKLPAKWPKPDQPYKWPTLDEAYRHFVDPEGFSNAHDAMADVQACAQVLFALERRGIPLVSIN